MISQQQKKRKRHPGRLATSKNKKLNVDEEPLDRFAGSSEEDEVDNQGNDEFDDDSDNEYGNANESSMPNHKFDDNGPNRSKNSIPGIQEKLDNYGDDESESDSVISEDENEDSHGILITSGLANAMSRILSSSGASAQKSSHVSSGTVILSKTKTPLQIQAAKEKKIQDTLKESRRLNRERKLKALHIPLTVATSMTVSNTGDVTYQNSLSAELEAERTHRRVATRGVVALFNAIAQHQIHPDETATAAASAADSVDPSKSTSVAATTKLTKCGFLDLIKQKAGATTSGSAINKISAEKPSTMGGDDSKAEKATRTKKWNALQDDYMMDSTKNWDEIDSD